MKKYFCLLWGITGFLSACQPAADYSEKIAIIPNPVAIHYQNKAFLLSNGVNIVIKDSMLKFSANYLAESLRKLTFSDELKTNPQGTSVVLSIDSSMTHPEAYRLRIDDTIHLTAKDVPGMIHGIESLVQIFDQATFQQYHLVIPRLEITDYPRFKYRGMHLDVCRHFFPVQFIKKYIDLIAMNKMNFFHWHLTDDQGWRIEIKKYPKLTQVGAWRVNHEDLPWNDRPDQKKGEKATYGGYYTQDQIRDVVAYAQKRGITVIPEIEMPGHSAAAIAAYPFLGCRGVHTTVPSGGKTKINIVCAGKESTFIFYENVLKEVMALFPSKYIHIGGDEADKTEWKKCPYCQKRMKKEGLANVEELQSYFIQRIGRFLAAHGRIMIGWDEILQGGLAKNATVMSWRGEQGGIDAARMKHHVIMTPVGYCYFDYYQSQDRQLEPLAFNGYISLDKVYNYHPIPDSLRGDQQKYVLGAQGNVWTEYMPTPDLVEYRVLPRMTALSEVLWSPASRRSEADFLQRLQPFLHWLSENHYRFHIPAPGGLLGKMLFLDSARVALTNPWPFSQIHYTLDGSDPSVKSPEYHGPFVIDHSQTLKTAIFLKSGKHGLVKTAVFEKTNALTAKPVDVARLESGIHYNYYEGKVSRLAQINKFPVLRSGIVADVGFPEKHRKTVFALKLDGYFYAPKKAVYTFSLISDDGSCLGLDNQLLINADGPHGPIPQYGQVALEKGYYPLHVGYFDAGGGTHLELQVKYDDQPLSPVSAKMLFHEK